MEGARLQRETIGSTARRMPTYRVWQSEQSLLVVGLPHASQVFTVIGGVCPFLGEGDAKESVWDSECFGDVVLADAVCLESLGVLDLLVCQSSSHVAS